MSVAMSERKQDASSQESAAGNRQIRQNGSVPLLVTESGADRVIPDPPGTSHYGQSKRQNFTGYYGDQRRRRGGGGKYHPNDDPGDERNPGGAKRRERDVTCPRDKTGRSLDVLQTGGTSHYCVCAKDDFPVARSCYGKEVFNSSYSIEKDGDQDKDGIRARTHVGTNEKSQRLRDDDSSFCYREDDTARVLACPPAAGI
ncbi:hypothetical protein Bbelb_067110 [Branchiostoma belcheri]|nr:hypothetical protein Bbelb_067110 [Branchiostoma belcheri]